MSKIYSVQYRDLQIGYSDDHSFYVRKPKGGIIANGFRTEKIACAYIDAVKNEKSDEFIENMNEI